MSNSPDIAKLISVNAKYAERFIELMENETQTKNLKWEIDGTLVPSENGVDIVMVRVRRPSLPDICYLFIPGQRVALDILLPAGVLDENFILNLMLEHPLVTVMLGKDGWHAIAYTIFDTSEDTDENFTMVMKEISKLHGELIEVAGIMKTALDTPTIVGVNK